MRNGERIIIIIGVGLALATMAATASWLVAVSILDTDSGWFAYAPSSEAVLPTRDGSITAVAIWSALIWMSAIAVWVAVALRIWRDPDPAERDPRPFLERMRDRS